VLVKQDGDALGDFEDVYCFSRRSSANYPWCCPRKLAGLQP
jgi:hypothetical protein